MRPLNLPFEDGRVPMRHLLVGHAGGWTGIAVLLIATGCAAVTSWQLVQVRQDLQSAQSELQAVVGRHRLVTTEKAKPTLDSEQRRAWNQVVRQLNTPWAALLASLEAATPQDVALVSIEPDARNGSVRLQAEAKTLDVLLAYAQALKTTGLFTEVAPLKHETNEQDPNRPVRLTLDIRLDARPRAALNGADTR